jgi:hypothetical protein
MILFLDLPVETRLTIYESLLVVCYDLHFELEGIVDELTMRNVLVPPANRTSGEKLHAQIIRTCRQIYREASPILYKRNCFDFAEAEPSKFLETIGIQAKRILNVGLDFPAVY